ncbi:hypothetical protein ACOSQ4_014436 [Xanthoceras sorbifolium]
MSRSIEEVMKDVSLSKSSELSESSRSNGESTDSEPHPTAQLTFTGIIDMDPDFESGPSTVVMDDIPVGVVTYQVPVRDLGVCQAEVALGDRAGRFGGWQLDLLFTRCPFDRVLGF